MTDGYAVGTIGVDPTKISWTEMFALIDAWLDYHYPVRLFGGDRLAYGDGSGIDTSVGYGPAAIGALRIASKLSRGEDAEL